ncbi:MAG: hypothetical protein K1000chlam3_01198 [Chlamydiae bacterium]|nr:hypothetical protein [Chlamydiota bacterium]
MSAIKSIAKLTVDLTVGGALVAGAGRLIQFGGAELLSHLENEKIASFALHILGNSMEGGGKFACTAGLFAATMIPYTVYYTSKWCINDAAPQVMPTAKPFFMETVLPALCELPSLGNEYILKPALENGTWLGGIFSQFVKDNAPSAIKESAKGIRWALSNAPNALYLGFNYGVIPVVSTVFFTALSLGAGILKLGFDGLWWLGENGSTILESPE